MDKKEYKVKAKYTFNGTFFVKANTREEAKDLIKKILRAKVGWWYKINCDKRGYWLGF